jgi:hypothetical protein
MMQIIHVATVMNTLNADVYAVQEVSDDAALDALLKISIGKTFAKSVSLFGPARFQATDPNFPQNSLQYSNYNHNRVMFSKLYDEVRAGTKLYLTIQVQ